MGGSVGGSPGNPGNGLPFAGIPWELQAGRREAPRRRARLAGTPLDSETFTHRMHGAGVSLRRMLAAAPADADALDRASSWSRRSCVQAGPFLSQIGIDDGITPHDWTVLAIIAVARHPRGRRRRRSRAASRVATTGRVASRVMFELRVRVFAHLQRLSLDYYTDEKAGVIMTRMTSDIESLQQLLQDGLRAVRACRGSRWSSSPSSSSSTTSSSRSITLLVIVPLAHRAVAVVPLGVRQGLPARARRDRRRAERPVREPVGVRVVAGLQPGAPQRAAPPQRRPASTATPTTTPPTSPRRTAPCTEFVGLHRPGDAAADRRQRWCATARSRSAS